MIHIVTAATDGFPQGTRYVQNLWDGLYDYFAHPFRLWIIGNGPPSHEIRKSPSREVDRVWVNPVRPVWGWWNKLEIFRPDAPWSGEQVIWMDLDMVIKGNLGWIIQDKPTFLRPWNPHGAFKGCYGTTLISLPAKEHYPEIWERSLSEVLPEETHTLQRNWNDQPWITDAIANINAVQPQFWQDVAQGKLCSYKIPKEKTKEPEESLVVFHGHPRPHEAEGEWIKKYWK